MGLADLHIHTIYSFDGTTSVPPVLSRARRIGLDVIAVTDHDEVAGALKAIENGLSHEILLNVNVPFLPDDQIRGISLTRQGLRVYHSRLDERSDPRGKPYYGIGGDAPTGVPERVTDVGALAEGFVSVTPLQLDLTAYRALTDLNTWQWDDQAGSIPSSPITLSDQPSEVKLT